MRYLETVILRACGVFLPMLIVSTATAQVSETKLTSGDGAASDNFGISVSLSGDYALVGAYEDDDKGTDAGSAYIFHFDGSGWVEQAKLTASDGAAGDNFGVSVSLSGDYALIGADWDDDNGTFSGSAYVFHYNGSSWVQQAKLLASDGDLFDNFGQSVSLSGDFALIGSLYNDDNGFASGSAYIFHREGTTWVEQAKLLASDGAPTDYFGWSVSLSGDEALIGANGANTSGADAGCAYIFQYDGLNWTEQAKLRASDRSASDNFGRAVSLFGDFALIASPYDSDNGTFSGSAYVFHYDGSGWVQQAKLLASDGNANDDFGLSVSLFEDYALVGAAYDDVNGTSGSAYIFHYDGSTWTEQTKILASDGAPFDYFGASVSLSGDKALIGAYQEDDHGSNSGAAYLYSGFVASISCGEIDRFQARCRPGGLVQARAIFTNTSHTGEVVEFTIDGVPYEVSVGGGGRALLSQAGFDPGPHTVELTDPPACFDPIVVNCPTGLGKDPDSWDDWEGPTRTMLFENYPNPFNPSTTIRYALSEDMHVTLNVYNTLGQVVATLVDQDQSAGYREVVWNGTNDSDQKVASGIYIYRMRAQHTGGVQAADFVETRRMMLLK